MPMARTLGPATPTKTLLKLPSFLKSQTFEKKSRRSLEKHQETPPKPRSPKDPRPSAPKPKSSEILKPRRQVSLVDLIELRAQGFRV